ncbi:hypothetical protein BEP19_02440 [Ammoniphilus oxalaticus]|uniref:HTH cro/C1-type domain-containing protein n=1 Tax=Ammoniphilus oxalaticus TaxID=66863 RepID=A0A419SNF1_9BACL|nr:helix-turn-helix transcriptional regulator [Ammoniphilus oxalaticus]RKD25816.1 hypothetical protein BEP19_02440 [Ammoniphilus oxalaticus]
MSHHEKCTIAYVVKSLRLRQHYTRQQLSTLARVSIRSIEEIESGRRTSPRLQTLTYILVVLCEGKAVKADLTEWELLRALIESILKVSTYITYGRWELS